MSHCYLAYVLNAAERPSWRVLKIGHTKLLVSRFKALQAMAWLEPTYFEVTQSRPDVRGCEIEHEMHGMLGRYEIKREWFHAPVEEIERVKADMARFYKTTFVEFDLEEERFVFPSEYPQEQAA